MKRRVLLVSPPESYRIQPYVRAAAALDIEIHLASQGEWAVSSPHSAGVSIPLDDPDAALLMLLELCSRTPYDAIIGTDDSTLELASELANKIGLQQNPPASVRFARRKDLSRQCLKLAGIVTPAFSIIEKTPGLAVGEPEFGFPCVIKPLALSGSRGVIRANNAQDLNEAALRSFKVLSEVVDEYEKNHLLIEEFIPGKEYAIEGMLTHGDLEILTIFDKPDPLDGPYFEETYYISPARINETERELLIACVEQSCAAFGLVKGPVHAECRLNQAGAWIIELAARTIGGLCSRLLRFGTGHTLEELVLANAVGENLSLQANGDAAGVLMIPIPTEGVLRRVEGVIKADKVKNVDQIEISLREGCHVIPLPEGVSYLGFVFASANNADRVEASLREANSFINPVIAPLWKLEQTKKKAST